MSGLPLEPRYGWLDPPYFKKSGNVLVEEMLADCLIVESLDHESHIAKWEMLGEDTHARRYELAIKGRALAMASAKPITRSTAERLVTNFLQRVEEVNGDPDLLLWVDEVQVFGSFLTESEMLGDVDLGVMYTRRTHDSEHFDALRKVLVREAEAAGRNFPLFIDKLFWPLREIELRLRNRSGSFSLHNLCEERNFIEALPHCQI